MKKSVLFAAVAALSLTICAPVQAQSRKDKKAAEKEQWEREQRYKAEEEELRHKMKMDSLRNVERKNQEIEAEAQAARLRAEEDRRKAEEEARVRLKKEEELAAMEEKDFDEPCTDAGSTESYIRARGIGQSLQQQMARTKAQTQAVRDLGAKIGTTVQALIKMYSNEETIDVLTDESSSSGIRLEEKIEGMVKQKVDQNLNFSTSCEKTKTFLKSGRKMYKCYMVIQAGKDDLLKPIYDQLQQDASLKLNVDYNRFSEEFDKEFNKQQDSPAVEE